MARIHLDLPNEFIYDVEISVRVSDLNYGGHLGHDSILTLMQEARVSMYKNLGFRDELSFEGAVGQIISDVAVVYKSEAFLGDVLVIRIAAVDFNAYRFDLLYEITRKTDGKEVARGKTGIACFNYDSRKVARVPKILIDKLTAHEHKN